MRKKLVAIIVVIIIISTILFSTEWKSKTDEELSDSSTESCFDKISQIPNIGTWEYTGGVADFDYLEISSNGSFEFAKLDGVKSTGKWTISENEQSITLAPNSPKYWEAEFNVTEDKAWNLANIDGLVAINEEPFQITFHINQVVHGECQNYYKSISIFG